MNPSKDTDEGVRGVVCRWRCWLKRGVAIPCGSARRVRWGCGIPAPGTDPWADGTAAGGKTPPAHMYNIGRFSDQPAFSGAEAGLFDDSGAGKRGVCALRRDAPQYFFGQSTPSAGRLVSLVPQKEPAQSSFAGQMTGVEGYIESASKLAFWQGMPYGDRLLRQKASCCPRPRRR